MVCAISINDTAAFFDESQQVIHFDYLVCRDIGNSDVSYKQT
jgi:hypothetical protein